jgi:uncharacterized protein YjbI with pentapeptide repeats
MIESSLPKTKKKITFTASEKGTIKAENSLKRLGFESKSSFATSQRISRSTVTKFFQREPIQLDSFQRICSALTLNWLEIEEMSSETEELKRSFILDRNIPDVTVEVGEMTKLRRQVTVLDSDGDKIKAVITLEGDIDSVDNWKTFQLILRQYSGYSINIIDVQAGSIRLILNGSSEDIQRIFLLIESGELAKLNGFPITDIELLNVSSNTEQDNKWQLVQEIIDHALMERDLRNRDLSDTDLSFTALRSANLYGANLTDANLSNANLTSANLNYANLYGADLRFANLSYANLGANLKSANLYGANFEGVKWCGANLYGASLLKANLFGADLRSVNLCSVNLIGASLRGAELTVTDLSDADLRFADLTSANLHYANLSNADLSCANLDNANLDGADLSLTDLRSANLLYANLSGVNNLSEANVKNTKFGHNLGISKSMKLDLFNRGAIFEDFYDMAEILTSR